MFFFFKSPAKFEPTVWGNKNLKLDNLPPFFLRPPRISIVNVVIFEFQKRKGMKEKDKILFDYDLSVGVYGSPRCVPDDINEFTQCDVYKTSGWRQKLKKKN